MLTVDHSVRRETLPAAAAAHLDQAGRLTCPAGHMLQGMWEASRLSLTLAQRGLEGTEQQQMTCAKGKEWELLNEERHVRESQHSLAAAPAHHDARSASVPGAFYSFVVSAQIRQRRKRGGQEEKMRGGERGSET